MEAAGRLRDEELRLPRGHIAAGVEYCPQVDQRRRALRIPAVLVAARPLHAHRAPDRLREQRGVAGRVLMAVAAVAARAFEVDAAYIRRGHSEHLRQL